MKRLLLIIIGLFLATLVYELLTVKPKDFYVENIDTNFKISLTQQEKNWQKEHKEISVGILRDFFPYSFFDEQGIYSGVSSSMLNIIEEKTGSKLKIVTFDDLSEAKQALKDKKIDILSLFNRDEEKEQTSKFSTEPYYIGFLAIFTNSKNMNNINSLSDLTGETVAIDRDTYKYSKTLKQKNFLYVFYDDTVKAVNDLNDGKNYALVGDLYHINAIISRYDYSKTNLATTINPSKFSLEFEVSEDNKELLSILNKIIYEVTARDFNKNIRQWTYSENVDLLAAKKRYMKYIAIIASVLFMSLLLSLINIYGLKRYNKYIKHLTNEYKDLLDKSPIAIFMQKDDLITYVNEEFLTLMGGVKESYLNKNYRDFFEEKDFELALKQSNNKMMKDIKVKRAGDCKTLYVNIKTNDIKIGGECLAFIMVIDVTERKLLEHERGELNKKNMLSQKLEMIGLMSGRVAHDFNNLIAGINGSAEFIQLNLPQESPLKKYTDIIINACSSAANMTKELLVFAKSRSNVFGVINVNETTKSCVSLLENSIKNYKSIKIKTKFEAKEANIYGNVDLFQNLIINLGINAKDALKNNGSITFETRNVVLKKEDMKGMIFTGKSGDYVELSVEDNGVGMTKEVQKNIFKPFFSTKKAENGTGLGMLAIYNIVKEHNATMKLVSAVNKGTKISIYFPVTKDKKIKKTKSKKTPVEKINAKILIVDDETILLELLKDILQYLGCEVVSAKSYEEAIDAFEKESFDISMLDVIMPDKSGIDVYEKIMEIKPESKIIFTTGYTKDKKIRAMLKSNPNLELIGKPYNIKDITEKLLYLLAKKD